MLKITSLLLVAILLSRESYSQDFVLQQPALQQFGVSSSLSIPDRGSAFLGGVTSSRSSTNHYGPFRSGSSIGNGLSHSSVNTSVYIHDFHLMDQILLAEGKRRLQFTPVNASMDPRVQHVLKKNAPRVKSGANGTPRTLQERGRALSVLRKYR